VISAWSTENVIPGRCVPALPGYILKACDEQEVLIPIRRVLRGGAPFDPFNARRITNQLQSTTGDGSASAENVLSLRETEILLLMVGAAACAPEITAAAGWQTRSLPLSWLDRWPDYQRRV
jgi:DNA-binding NarL/FixJ family response regulator